MSVKGNVDDFDYDVLIQESRSWLKTWNKIKKIGAIPLSIVSFLFRKNKKNETSHNVKEDILNNEYSGDKDNQRLLDSLLEELKLKVKEDKFDLSEDDLKDFMDNG